MDVRNKKRNYEGLSINTLLRIVRSERIFKHAQLFISKRSALEEIGIIFLNDEHVMLHNYAEDALLHVFVQITDFELQSYALFLLRF